MTHSPLPWTADQPVGGFTSIRDAEGNIVFALAAPGAEFGDPPLSVERKYANLDLILEAVNAQAR